MLLITVLLDQESSVIIEQIMLREDLEIDPMKKLESSTIPNGWLLTLVVAIYGIHEG